VVLVRVIPQIDERREGKETPLPEQLSRKIKNKKGDPFGERRKKKGQSGIPDNLLLSYM